MKNIVCDEEESQMLESDSDMEGKYLTFFVDKQLIATPIADVVQIIGMQTITEIPDSVSYMKGVINLRGSIIPVIDIRLRLGKKERDYDGRTCIIVVLIQEKEVGLIVDEVDAVIEIDAETISQPPKTEKKTNQNYLSGIAKLENNVVLLIDSAKLLYGELMDNLEQYV